MTASQKSQGQLVLTALVNARPGTISHGYLQSSLAELGMHEPPDHKLVQYLVEMDLIEYRYEEKLKVELFRVRIGGLEAQEMGLGAYYDRMKAMKQTQYDALSSAVKSQKQNGIALVANIVFAIINIVIAVLKNG